MKKTVAIMIAILATIGAVVASIIYTENQKTIH